MSAEVEEKCRGCRAQGIWRRKMLGRICAAEGWLIDQTARNIMCSLGEKQTGGRGTRECESEVRVPWVSGDRTSDEERRAGVACRGARHGMCSAGGSRDILAKRQRQRPLTFRPTDSRTLESLPSLSQEMPPTREMPRADTHCACFTRCSFMLHSSSLWGIMI